MQWVFKQNEDGSYLIGDTSRGEEFWQTADENVLYSLNMMNSIYGVTDNGIKPQGSLSRIADRYNASLKIAGLGSYVKARVVNVRDNSVVTWNNVGKSLMGISVQTLIPDSFLPKKSFKVPEFVEVIQGMSWFFNNVSIPPSVKTICCHDREDSVYADLRTTFESKVNIASTKCFISDYAFSRSTCTDVFFSAEECDLHLSGKSFKDAKMLRSIRFPEGIRSLRSRLFLNCSSLENVVLPDSLKSIGADTFVDCNKLRYLWLPDRAIVVGRENREEPMRFRLSLETLERLYGMNALTSMLKRLSYIIVSDSNVLRRYLNSLENSRESRYGYVNMINDMSQIVIVLKDDSREGVADFYSRIF